MPALCCFLQFASKQFPYLNCTCWLLLDSLVRSHQSCRIMQNMMNQSMPLSCPVTEDGHESLLFQVKKAELSKVKADLAERTQHATQLDRLLQSAQDGVAEARADAHVAKTNLQSAEERVVELSDNLQSAKLAHDQAVGELQEQHAAQVKVSSSCDMPAVLGFGCSVVSLRALVCTAFYCCA